MKLKLYLTLIILFLSITSSAQALSKIADRIVPIDPFGKYYYIQASYSRLGSHNQFGVQYKRIKTDAEVGFFVMSGYSSSLNILNVGTERYYSSITETHLLISTYTFLFRVGVGANIMSNLRGQNYFSPFPSISIDVGGAEISYSYLFNSKLPGEMNGSVLKISLGVWFKHRARGYY